MQKQSDRVYACENVKRIVKTNERDFIYIDYICIYIYIHIHIYTYEVNRGIKEARSPIDNQVELLTERIKVADGKNRRI